jgi:hypothetical protein
MLLGGMMTLCSIFDTTLWGLSLNAAIRAYADTDEIVDGQFGDGLCCALRAS